MGRVGWVALVALGCGGEEEPGDGAPGPGAFAEDFATSDAFFTQMAGPVDAGSVHGRMQIWYSVNVEDRVVSGDPFVAPEGTVAIKAQGAGELVYKVMIKGAAGTSPETGDWTFEQRDPDFAVTDEGALAGCWGCHQSYPDTDGLAGTEVR